jgi:hypothetical protein
MERNSNIRNVCFELPNGTMHFFNYGYLISVKYQPEESTILLFFTSDVVTLEGKQLEYLFFGFMEHSPKHISCNDPRYNAIKDEKSFVNKISILPNKE